jgi:hypothetical protein
VITLPGAKRPKMFTRCIVSLRDGPAFGVADFNRGSADITDYIEVADKVRGPSRRGG